MAAAAANAMDNLAPSPHPSSDDGCPGKDNTKTVQVFVIMAVAAMFVLHVLGSLRRRSGNGLLHGIVMGVYTLSYPLVSFTIARMNSSDWYYNDFAVWAVFLLLLLGSTDTLTACRLNDIDNWKSMYVKHIFKGFLLGYVLWNMFAGDNKPPPPYLLPLLAILLVVVLKWYVRIASMRMVSKSYLCKNMKVVAQYMEHKDNHLLVPFDPVTMEGYRYMVAGEKYCSKRWTGCTPWYKGDGLLKVTTVEQVWQGKGNLLLIEYKDVCLSMALSKMLNRRFAGFKLSEAKLQKTHDFVFKGLLAAGDKPYQRAFRIIEEELGFVHDMYYTRYSYLYQKCRFLALCLPVIMVALCSWLTCLLIKPLKDDDLRPETMFVTVALAFLEAYQLYLYTASGWFKVALIRSYVNSPFLQRSGCFLETFMGLLLRFKSFRPWKRTLGQYCILQDLGRKSWVRNCLHYATLRLVDKANKRPEKSVKLSEDVKKAIVDSLLARKQWPLPHLTNGVTSLQRNRVHGLLSWACDATATDGAVARTVVVWHIATTLCEQKLDKQTKEEDAAKTASTLSKYCMHLLAFAPNLLPDHSSISESILDESIGEAGELLKGAKDLGSRCDKLMEISTHNGGGGGGGETPPLVVQGAQLARHLIEGMEEPKLRWKVLSDFWAEMMLYVSPSDDARAHLEALAKGGEFITHLWALLTHAGVLKRGPTGTNNV